MKLLSFILFCLSFGAHGQALPEGARAHNPDWVTLYGHVDDKSASQVASEIQYKNQQKSNSPILLFINSGGGSAEAGGLIVDAIEASRRPVYTICVSFCASMAAIVHSYGAKRIVFPRAVLMWHNPSVRLSGDVSHLNQELALINRVWISYEEHLAKVTGWSLSQIRDRENENWLLLGEEAVTAKVATEVAQFPIYPAP
jgi:ATP-dependent Clp protease protease subunit